MNSTRHLPLALLLVAGTASAQTAPTTSPPPPSTTAPPAAPPTRTAQADPTSPATSPPPSAPSEPSTEPAPLPPAPAPGADAAAPPAAPAPASPSVEKKLEPAKDKKEETPLEVKPGGYLQADTREFAADSGQHEQTLRRLRFKVDGKALRYFKFRTLIETAQSKLQVLDAWIELGRPELGLRVGKDKGQFGIERLQSAAELTFIERAYPTQLAPNRDIGIALRGDIQGGLVHYSAAVVNGVADNAVLEGETDNDYEYNLHLLIKPLAASADLAQYGEFAIGGATTFGFTHGSLTSPGLTAIKSAGQATIFSYAGGGKMDTIDTTAVADGYRKRFTGHAYYFGGPIGALAEYVIDDEPVRLQGTHTLLRNTAWQLALSGALTRGDQPSYKSIVPKRPFDPSNSGWGAVELAARYSELRIDADAFTTGLASSMTSVARVRAGTLGVNWYLNKWIKLQLDYEGTHYTGGAANGDRATEHLIATRFQAAI